MDQLNLLDQVSIKQGIEIWEVSTDFDTLNRYTVLGPAGENLLMVMESRTKGSLFFDFYLNQRDLSRCKLCHLSKNTF